MISSIKKRHHSLFLPRLCHLPYTASSGKWWRHTSSVIDTVSAVLQPAANAVCCAWLVSLCSWPAPFPLPLRTFPCPLSLISICPNFAKLKSFSTWFSHHDTFHSKRWRPPNLPPTHKYHPQSKLLWWSSFQQMSKWNVTNVAWNKNRTNIWSYPLLCVELQN